MPPFRFVVADQYLVVQSIDLHRHRAKIGGKVEHAGQRFVVQKPQSGGRLGRLLERILPRSANPQTPNDGTAA